MKRIGLPVLFGLITILLFVQVLLAQATVTVDKNANLRAGPGTNFAVVGGAKAGTTVTIIGSNAAGDWYQLEDGKWIAAFLVKHVEGDVPTVDPSATVSNSMPVDKIQVEANYVEEIRPILGEYVTSLNTFAALMEDAKKDPALFGNGGWKIKVANILGSWNKLPAEIHALRPPVSLAYVHNQLLIAATHYATASRLVANGIDGLNMTLFQAAGVEMRLGLEAIRVVGNAINSMPTVTSTAKAYLPAIPTTYAPKTAAPGVSAPFISASNTPAASAIASPVSPATTTGSNCDPSYPTLCIPPDAPDLDCGDINDKRFTVLPPDPHRFDRDKDGIGCES